MEAVYNTIGQGYNRTRRADPAILTTLQGLLGPVNGGAYLDVACGTGNYTRKLAEGPGDWWGVDVSEHMLNQARSQASAVQWNLADVARLPYANAQFDGATCSLALHHFADLNKTFAEISRVLKTGATFVVFTATPEQTGGYWLRHYFPDMIAASCETLPSLPTIETALARGELTVTTTQPFFVTEKLQDLFLYSGKQRPHLYLQEHFRNGISSFHKHCDAQALTQGLEQLQADIEDGAIDTVIADYASNDGDYLFIQAHKQRK